MQIRGIKKMIKWYFAIGCLLMPLAVVAHTVEYTILKRGVGLEAYYADGTVISFSGVKVFSPDDASTPFQEGSTDKNGRFVFYPDKSGKWKIEVNDGMGHGIITDINVNDALTVSHNNEHDRPVIETIIMGICIIFGLTGILFYLATRKRAKVNPLIS